MKSLILLTLGLAFALPLHAEDDAPAVPAEPAAPAAPVAPAKEKAKHTPEEMFKKKDKDGDGFISKDEFTKGSKDATKSAAAFAKKDKDGDGKISPAEMAAAMVKGKGKGKKKNQ